MQMDAIAVIAEIWWPPWSGDLKVLALPPITAILGNYGNLFLIRV